MSEATPAEAVEAKNPVPMTMRDFLESVPPGVEVEVSNVRRTHAGGYSLIPTWETYLGAQ